MKALDEQAGDGFMRQRIRYESEPGIEIDATLYVPATPGRKQAVLLVAGELPNRLAERFVRMRKIVLIVEPRRSLVQDDRYPFVGDWLANSRADQIGVSLPAVRAHDILRGVDLLSARQDVDPHSIRAAAQGVKGIWLLLAAAADPRIQKVWLDRTPPDFSESLHSAMNTGLNEVAIHGFALRWDLEDLVKAMGDRPVMWTDPTGWMSRVAAKGPRFQYRWVLGDLTDMSDIQNMEFAQELVK